MKRILLLLTLVLFIAAGYVAFLLFAPSVKPGDRDGQYIYIESTDDLNAVKRNLLDQHYIRGKGFDLAARILKYTKVRPGRYKIAKGMSVFKLVRMLRNGQQSTVKMVIIKERTKELFAGKFGRGKRFDSETDSLAMISFLSNPDSLRQFDLDTNTVMAAVVPLTYEVNWNSSASRIFRQFYSAYKKFWTEDRISRATALGLSPVEATTLASIVEEETNLKADKYNIASTYINRLRTGMKLQADPTVKFALKDFGIKRVTGKYLGTDSPFNTYQHTGLPPGPICTPSLETMDAVLNAPVTDYLYFVASDKFDGTSIFTSDYEEHKKYAKLYQQALDRRWDSLQKAKGN